jgi:hypothetical protein
LSELERPRVYPALVTLRPGFRSFVFVCLGSTFVFAGCAEKLASGDGAETETGNGDLGDGDGDPGDGDADPETGDGDGDPETGDGDGDPETGDGDGDGETGDGDGDGDGDALPELTYLLAIETVLGPDLPLQFVLDVFNLVQTNDGVTGDFVLQPLSLAQGQTTPGECIGEPLEYEGILFQSDFDGSFVVDMGLVMISGEANPVTGSDMEATMVLHGQPVAPDAMCGDMTGILMSPLEYDLAGSTFAAIPLAGGCDADFFPAPIYNCSML